MSTFQKHFDAIASGKITRSNIIGMRKGFNAWGRASRGYSTSRTNPGFTNLEADELMQAIFKHHPTALGEIHDSGLKVLRNPRYAKRWTDGQRTIIERAVRFDLIRFDWIGARGDHCVPVYRVISRRGDSFAFRNIPWQSAWSLGEEDGPRVVES